MKKVVLMVIVIMISCVFLSADVYVKTQVRSGAMMGQPAKDVIMEQWIASDKLAIVSQGQVTIIDLAAKKFSMVFNESKSYLETPLPLDMMKILPDQAKQMMGMMKLKVTVTPTKETKKIKEWNCKKYIMEMDLTMMKMTTNVWCTTDVPFDWKSYHEKMYGVVMSTSMPLLDEKGFAEFKKLEGFQVATDMNMSVMGQDVKVNNDVLEISKKEAPKGIYSVPAGYKKVDKIIPPTGK